MSAVEAVFAPVRSFATTEVRVPRSEIGAIRPLRVSKVAVLGEVIWWKSEVEVSFIRGVKLLCSPLMQNYWPDGLLDFSLFRLVSALFSACLIFFPSTESIAIESVSDSASVSHSTTGPSVILIKLFLRFSFAVKSSQRSLVSLVSSLFKADERFWTICKICSLYSNCSLYVWILKCPQFWRFYLMEVATFSLFPQNVYQSSLSLIQRGLDCL